KITNAITKMICEDVQPFSMVEDKGFVGLLQLLEPRYKIPSRSTFSRAILPNTFQKSKIILRKEIETSISKISLTADLWTSCQTESYLATTAHFISEEGVVITKLLALHNSVERNTAAYISEAISSKIISEIKDMSKVFALVTDNAKSIINATDLLKLHHHPCVAHTLNLVVGDSLKIQRSVCDMLQISKNLATLLHRSTIAAATLHKAQANLGMAEHGIPQAIVTRWNSSLHMLQALLKQKNVLTYIAQEQSTIRAITYNHWDIMASLVRLLEPFDEVTKLVSGHDSSIGQIIPLIYGLQKVLSETDAPGVGSISTQLLHGLRSRFGVLTSNNFYKAATVLDPRYKAKFLPEPDTANVVAFIRLHAETSLEKVTRSETLPMLSPNTSETVNGRSVLHLIQTMTSSDHLEHDSNLDSLDIYMAENTTPMTSNPAKYWKSKLSEWPSLSRFALTLIACPSTSVASERVFST
uniref:HAT C-terminal dimerisation domain-containing protein n=1 Tax=Ciona savignyi TaxID=51511 RepID=H2ZR45_CIOSA